MTQSLYKLESIIELMAEILDYEKTNDGDFLLLMRISAQEFKKIKNDKNVLVFSKRKAGFVSDLELDLTQKLDDLGMHENCVIVTFRSRLRDLELAIIEYLEEKKCPVVYLSCEIAYEEFVEIIKFRKMMYGDSLNLKNVFFIGCGDRCGSKTGQFRERKCIEVPRLTDLSDIGLAIEEAVRSFVSVHTKPLIFVVDSWSRILRSNAPSSNEKFAKFLNKLMDEYPITGIFIFKHLEYREDATRITNPKFVLRV